MGSLNVLTGIHIVQGWCGVEPVLSVSSATGGAINIPTSCCYKASIIHGQTMYAQFAMAERKALTCPWLTMTYWTVELHRWRQWFRKERILQHDAPIYEVAGPIGGRAQGGQVTAVVARAR